MPTDPRFHMTVEDVFTISGRGTVVTGTIEAGLLRVGDEIVIRGRSADRKALVSGIELFRKIVSEAGPGAGVGLLLRDIKKGEVEKGNELVSPDGDFSWQP